MFWYGIQTFTGVYTRQLPLKFDSAYPLEQVLSALNRYDFITRHQKYPPIWTLCALDAESYLAKPSHSRPKPSP